MITINKIDLENLIFIEKKSYKEIGETLNVSGSYIRKLAKQLDILLPNRRKLSEKETFNKGRKIKKHNCINCGDDIGRYYSGKKYCSVKCQFEYQTKESIEKWKEDPTKFKTEDTPDFIRRFIVTKYDGKCQECGWNEKNIYTDSIPLELHHIDGDCTNNNENNLQLLCPNCHSLTENFGSRNKNSTRIDKRIR